MKQYFLYAVLFLIPLAILGRLLFSLAQSLLTSFDDWQHQRDLRDLPADREELREMRRQENEQRLDNGCEHDFGDYGFGLPPNVCSKCGLAKTKPAGPCDHVWRLDDGAVPGSYCEKCSATHNFTNIPGSFG